MDDYAQPLIRRDPRFSLSPLAWYIHTLSPSARRTIIQQQREPRTYRTAPYQPIQVPIQRFLHSGGTDTATVLQAVEHLSASAASPLSEWEKVHHPNCISGLHHMLRVATMIDFSERRLPTATQGTMMISDLRVSVRPEALLVSGPVEEPAEAGAIKIYFTKTRPLTEAVAFDMAIVLQMYVQLLFPHTTVPRHLCQVVDLHAEKVWTPPRNQTRRQRNITAGCQEIRAWWDYPQAAA